MSVAWLPLAGALASLWFRAWPVRWPSFVSSSANIWSGSEGSYSHVAVRIQGFTAKTMIYQASTSELYGMVQEIAPKGNTSFYPHSAAWSGKMGGWTTASPWAISIRCMAGITRASLAVLVAPLGVSERSVQLLQHLKRG